MLEDGISIGICVLSYFSPSLALTCGVTSVDNVVLM